MNDPIDPPWLPFLSEEDAVLHGTLKHMVAQGDTEARELLGAFIRQEEQVHSLRTIETERGLAELAANNIKEKS